MPVSRKLKCCALSLVPLSITRIKRVLYVGFLEYVSCLTHETKYMDKIFEFLNEDEKRDKNPKYL